MTVTTFDGDLPSFLEVVAHAILICDPEAENEAIEAILSQFKRSIIELDKSSYAATKRITLEIKQWDNGTLTADILPASQT